MLDPFTALSLASSIVQFVDFGTKLVGKTTTIYKSASGTSQEIINLQAATSELDQISQGLRKHYPHTSQADQGITVLASLCSDQASELLIVLKKIAGKPGDGKWRSFLHALEGEVKKEKIEALRSNLARFQTQIILHLAMLTSDQQTSIAKELGDLSVKSNRLDMNVSNHFHHMEQSIEELRQIIYESIRRSGFKNIYDHDTFNESSQAMTRDPVAWSLAQQKDNEQEVQVRCSSKEAQQITTKAQEVVSTGYSITMVHEILRSLRFDSITVRESNIARAHDRTFDWILEESTEAENNFLHWLLYLDGIFWVSGKPGSGKSTLMKYLCSHEKTIEFLRQWAGVESPVTASYFFWNAGTPMQKSQQGLLQTLLYWVLRECPNLAESICPKRWADLYVHKDSSSTSPPWTRDELFEVFNRLVKQKTSSSKFCFFIDGLDEYDGDHSEIVDILNHFSKSKFVKICVSSRPWNVFQAAYSQETSRFLRLQDLTRGDIDHFVRDNLVENKQFEVLRNIDTRYNSLVKEIVNKAEGVFLWVFLVVRSLKEGITNADSIAVLTRRLHELPSDLESFFKHILGQVERVYREGTTQMFQLAITAVEPLPLMEYSILDEEPDFALKLTPRHLSDEEIDKHCEILEKSLNARCKGLLEVTMQNKSSNKFCKRRVDFLHRTVRDFLRLREVQEILAAHLSQPFDIYLALCRGLLIRAKRLQFFDQKTLRSIMDDLTHYATLIERLFQHPPTEIIDEMTCLMVKNSQVVRPFMGSSLNEPNWGRKISNSEQLHPFVFQKGLQHYIEGKLPKIPVVYNYTVDRFSLLDAALLLPAIPSKYDSFPHPSLVRLLLDNGENPNAITYHGETTWTNFLKNLFELGSLPSESRNTWFATVEILLQGGADCNVRVYACGRTLSPMQIFDSIFTKEEASALKRLCVSGQFL